MLRILAGFVFLLRVCGLITSESLPTPRMVFTAKEAAVERFSLPNHHEPIQTVLNERIGLVISVGQTHLYLRKSPNDNQIVKVKWQKCAAEDCGYNITLAHQRGENCLFLCGTNNRDTTCCNVSQDLLSVSGSHVFCETQPDNAYSTEGFIPQHAVFAESGPNADLYVTSSGAQVTAGIYKFGRRRVRPANHDKEQHYVGLMMSRGRTEALQDKVYAFYKQRNKDTGMYSPMWLPFISQVCMADIGGPKNMLQFSWTSLLNARLFCGDRDSKRYFSELVEVTTVHADQWEDSKVYALFRNEWGMSAVCTYTIGSIDSTFTQSPFIDSTQIRERKCVSDSTKILAETLKSIEKVSELEQPVMPDSFFYLRHNCTHINVDPSKHKGNHTVFFLTLDNGRIYKVLHSERDFFIIAEYQPFNHRAHIHSVTVCPSSTKLYVNSGSEVVKLDVANCAQYGKTCEDCFLSRDPHCRWTDSTCSLNTRDPHPDIFIGNHTSCQPLPKPAKVFSDPDNVMIDHKDKIFLQCPMSSHHAQYTWTWSNNSTSCMSREKQCLLPIDSMSPGQAETYTCKSEESGYEKDVVQYHLKLSSTAAERTLSPTVWLCLVAVLTFWC